MGRIATCGDLACGSASGVERMRRNGPWWRWRESWQSCCTGYGFRARCMSRSVTARWPRRRKRSGEMEMGKETLLDGVDVRTGATTWHEVEHNRRYGADCVPRLGRVEAVAEIAAPHPKRGTPSGTELKSSMRVRMEAGREANTRPGGDGNRATPGSQLVGRFRSAPPRDAQSGSKKQNLSQKEKNIMKFEGDCGLPLVGPVDLAKSTAF